MSDTTAAAVAAALVNRALQGKSQNRHIWREDINEQAVRNGGIEGFLMVSGPGESIAELYFPVEFLEKPVFGAGLEVEHGRLLDGAFPVWSATVYDWVKRGRTERITYLGVRLAIVIIGPDNPYELHYSFRGQSFTNPTGATTTVGGTL